MNKQDITPSFQTMSLWFYQMQASYLLQYLIFDMEIAVLGGKKLNSRKMTSFTGHHQRGRGILHPRKCAFISNISLIAYYVVLFIDVNTTSVDEKFTNSSLTKRRSAVQCCPAVLPNVEIKHLKSQFTTRPYS